MCNYIASGLLVLFASLVGRMAEETKPSFASHVASAILSCDRVAQKRIGRGGKSAGSIRGIEGCAEA